MNDRAHPIATYAEFWPFYLGEHALAATRAVHICGTCASVLCLVGAIVFRNWWLAGAALAAGYAPAWAAHFFIEHNHPATFRYPLWSLVSDFRMTAAWFGGRLSHEIEKAKSGAGPA